MSAAVVRANSVSLPLADESVDLIVTSPPYFALRSYRDQAYVVGPDGKVYTEQVHYDGQIGSEPTPQAFLEALWAVTAECWRVLKPTGSMFVNLGDKRSGSGGHNNANLSRLHQNYGRPSTKRHAVADDGHRIVGATRRNAPDRYNQAAFGRPKSKMLLPHRFAIGCEDGLADPCVKDHEHVGRHPAFLPHERCQGMGWVVRQDIVWSKPNGLPESVTDRVRDSHEYWFHLTKQGRYFSAVDEVREGYAPGTADRYASGYTANRREQAGIHNQGVTRSKAAGDWESGDITTNPLGKLPGSVWTIPSEPLVIPDAVKAHYDLPDHFAAFPTEWPRRLILGWSPSGVCVACGEGRRPVVAKDRERATERVDATGGSISGGTARSTLGHSVEATITGYACACPDITAPTRPAIVIDPFGGTGTVAGVARQLGRFAVSFDLSGDYSRLARYFLTEGRGRFAKASSRTDRERQGALL
jgi:DNA modification methylase